MKMNKCLKFCVRMDTSCNLNNKTKSEKSFSSCRPSLRMKLWMNHLHAQCSFNFQNGNRDIVTICLHLVITKRQRCDLQCFYILLCKISFSHNSLFLPSIQHWNITCDSTPFVLMNFISNLFICEWLRYAEQCHNLQLPTNKYKTQNNIMKQK